MEKEETNDNKVQLRPSSSHSHDSLYERICQTLTIKEQAKQTITYHADLCLAVFLVDLCFDQVDVTGGSLS